MSCLLVALSRETQKNLPLYPFELIFRKYIIINVLDEVDAMYKWAYLWGSGFNSHK